MTDEPIIEIDGTQKGVPLFNQKKPSPPKKRFNKWKIATIISGVLCLMFLMLWFGQIGTVDDITTDRDYNIAELTKCQNTTSTLRTQVTNQMAMYDSLKANKTIIKEVVRYLPCNATNETVRYVTNNTVHDCFPYINSLADCEVALDDCHEINGTTVNAQCKYDLEQCTKTINEIKNITG